MNIKLTVDFLQYSEKISQAHQPADLTVQAINTIMELHDSDGNWDDPKAHMINERDWPNRSLLKDNQYPFGLHHQERLHTQGREETDWDDPLEQMIERAPHTITEADDTIIKTSHLCGR